MTSRRHIDKKSGSEQPAIHDEQVYMVYLTKNTCIAFERVTRIFIDENGNLTIFSRNLCIAGFPAKSYLYVVNEKSDTAIETVEDSATIVN